MHYTLIQSEGIFNATNDMRRNYTKFQSNNEEGENYRTCALRTWHLYDDSSLKLIITLKESMDYIDGKPPTLGTTLSIHTTDMPSYNIANGMERIINRTSVASTFVTDMGEMGAPNKYGHHLLIYLSNTPDEYLYMLFNTLKNDNAFSFPVELINEIKTLKYDVLQTEEDIEFYRTVDEYIEREKFQEAIDYVARTYKALEPCCYHCDYPYYVGLKLTEIPHATNYAFMAFRITSYGKYYDESQRQAFFISRANLGDESLTQDERAYWLRQLTTTSLVLCGEMELKVLLRVIGNFCGNLELSSKFLDVGDQAEDSDDEADLFYEPIDNTMPTELIVALAKMCREQNDIIKDLRNRIKETGKLDNLTEVEVARPVASQSICSKSDLSSNPSLMFNQSLKCNYEDLSWIRSMFDNSIVEYMSANPNKFALTIYKPPRPQF